MQTNGKPQRENVRSMLLMMMYLAREAEENHLKRTQQMLLEEIQQLLQDFDMTEDDIIPEKKE